MTKARLQVLDGPQEGEAVVFADSLLIGRSSAVGLALKDATVSREHARIFQRRGQWFVVDLKSSNGTHLHGRQVTRAELHDGDEFLLGTVPLRFELLEQDLGPRAPAAERVEESEIELPDTGTEQPPSAAPAPPPASAVRPAPSVPVGSSPPPTPGLPPVRRLGVPPGATGSRPLPGAGSGLLQEDLGQWGLLPKLLVYLGFLVLGAALFYFAFRLASGM